MTIYDFKVKTQKGEDFDLSNYKEKVLLVVNTATGCGFTPQYEGLEELYKKYKEKGFEILDFPCNQFLNQAPGTDEEINSFCTLRYNTTFPRFKKIKVNGKEADPLYKWLQKEKKSGLSSRIKWNFTKFLINKNGEVVSRFGPTVKPSDIEESIIKELNNAR